MDFVGKSEEPLDLLEDETRMFVGRKKSIHKQYGDEGTLLIGKSVEQKNIGKHIYLDAISPHVIFATGSRGSGKCLHPDETVLLANGNIKPIKEIYDELSKKGRIVQKNEKEELIKISDSKKVIGINNSLNKTQMAISHIYKKKISEDMIKLKTRSGKEITVTQEHPLFCGKELEWKKAGDIKKGEYIGTPRIIETENSEKLPSINGKICLSNNKSQIEDKILNLLKQGPLQAYKLGKILNEKKIYIYLHKMQKNGLITLKRNSPLTASLTSTGKKIVQSFSDSWTRLSTRSIPIKMPKRVSKELAKFMAYLIAEGTEVLKDSNYRIMFTNKEEEKREEFAKLAKKLFGLKSRDNDISKYIDSWNLYLLLNHWGYKTGNKSKKKDIPGFITSANKEITAEFLRYYIDCEGHISRTVPEIEIPSASKNIASKLSYLLLQFGIFSFVKEKMKYAANTENKTKRKYYHVLIRGTENLNKFNDMGGFLVQRKQKALEKYLRKNSNPNFDTLPSVGKDIRFLRQALKIAGKEFKNEINRSKIFAYERELYSPSRKTLSEIVETFENEYKTITGLYKSEKINKTSKKSVKNLIKKSKTSWAEIGRLIKKTYHSKRLLDYASKKELEKIKIHVLNKLEKITSGTEIKNRLVKLKQLSVSDIYWDQITEIKKERYEGYVYDLTIPKIHNFIAGNNGGIICHNSYSLGCIAEELVMKNPNVGSVIIDPIGIFWSMKYPNKDEKELALLGEWGLEPKGINNVQVFVPKGMKKKIPNKTYDRLFSLKPAELTVDDWCLTFGLDRFGTTALLLEKTIEKASQQFDNRFSIEDMINIANKNKDLTDKTRGYKADTRRALTSRLEAAKSWGILDKDSTDLSEICKEGHISVIDISFLEESVSSLVIGMLAKKILNARKLVTRKATMGEYIEGGDLDDLLNIEIPPTWLFIDEAHTLIPAGASKTAATDALIEYVKQGRRPGCSLVFATQQPSAIDTRVLSQLDVVLCHKLVFDEDLKAIMKRMPTLIPKEYERSRFLKTLPIGIALTGDRSDLTSRAFCIQIRPRYSQHEGRESHSVELDKKQVDPQKLLEMVTELIFKKIEQRGSLKLYRIDETTDTIRRRYEVALETDKIIKRLVNVKGCEVDDESVYLKKDGEKQKTEEKKEETPKEEKETAKNILALKKIDINKIAEKNKKKKFLMFGKDERVSDVSLNYEQIYKVNFDAVLPRGYKPKSIYVDQDYELYYWKNGLKKTKHINELLELTKNEVAVLQALQKTKGKKKLEKKTKMTAQGIARVLRSLVEKGYVVKTKKENYKLAKKMKIPESITKPEFDIKDKLEFGEIDETGNKTKPHANEDILKKIPGLFEKAKVKDVEVFWKPVYHVSYDNGTEQRILKVDAI